MSAVVSRRISGLLKSDLQVRDGERRTATWHLMQRLTESFVEKFSQFGVTPNGDEICPHLDSVDITRFCCHGKIYRLDVRTNFSSKWFDVQSQNTLLASET